MIMHEHLYAAEKIEMKENIQYILYSGIIKGTTTYIECKGYLQLRLVSYRSADFRD